MSAKFRTSLPPVSMASADDTQKELLEQARASLGFVPNMYAGMVSSPGVLATYLLGYEKFREASGFSPAEQEVVFLTISRYNGCHYCMAAHSTLADQMSGVAVEVTEAIRDDRPIGDRRLAALSAFTRRMVDSRGRPTPDEVAEFTAVGFEERHIFEIILAIAVKTLSNYANHITHVAVDDMFRGRAWQPA